MIREGIGINWGSLAAIYLALVLFGIGFNLLTGWVERRGYMKGYTSLFVASGVTVTVGMMALVNPVFALVMAGAFAASGLPMITGSIWRHMQEREQELLRLRMEARNGDETKAVAE